MSFSGSYWSATKQIASTDNLTDFSFIVAELPVAFFLACTSTDGTKLRCAKDDGVTELAFDPIEFVPSTNTVVLRAKWSGSITPTGTYTLRIYPALTENISYGVSDTYGQYNAYSSSFAYYSPNGDGENDRTINQISGSYTGTPTIDAEPGLSGKSTLYTGSTDFWRTTDTKMLNTSEMSMSMVFKHSGGSPYTLGDQSSQSMLRPYNGTMRYYHGGTGFQSSAYPYDAYNYAYASIDSAGNVKTSVNDSTEYTTTMSTSDTMANFAIGYHYSEVSIYIQHIIKMSTNISDSWRIEEYSQISDNSTFWGTWTETTSGTTEENIIVSGTETESGIIDLLSAFKILLSGSELESGIIDLISNTNISLSGIESESGIANLLSELLISSVGTETENGTVIISDGNELSIIVSGIESESGIISIIGNSAIQFSGEESESGTIDFSMTANIPFLGLETESGIVDISSSGDVEISGEIKISMTMTVSNINMTMTVSNINMTMETSKISMEMET